MHGCRALGQRPKGGGYGVELDLFERNPTRVLPGSVQQIIRPKEAEMQRLPPAGHQPILQPKKAAEEVSGTDLNDPLFADVLPACPERTYEWICMAHTGDGAHHGIKEAIVHGHSGIEDVVGRLQTLCASKEIAWKRGREECERGVDRRRVRGQRGRWRGWGRRGRPGREVCESVGESVGRCMMGEHVELCGGQRRWPARKVESGRGHGGTRRAD